MATELDGVATLAFVKELTKSVADLNKEISKTGDHAGVGVRKGREETERFGQTIERRTANIAGMNLEMGRLGGLIRGFGGAATLAYGAFKLMDTHVKEGLQLRNFATDLGLSAQAVGRLRTQLSAAGIDSKTADQQISALMAKLDDIKTLETASSTYRDLAANDKDFAEALRNSEKYGTRLESIAIIEEKLRRTGEPKSTMYALDKLGLNRSTAEALTKDWGDRLVMPKTWSIEEMQKFNESVTNIGTTASNIWGDAMHGMVTTTNEVMKNTHRQAEELKAIREKIMSGKDVSSDEWMALLLGKEWLEKPSKKEEKKGTFSERFGEWGDADEGALPKNARPRSFSPDSVVKDELDIQKQSNKTLQDIRNLLDDKNKGTGGGADGSSSGNTPGTPNRGSTGADHVPETTGDPAYGGTPTGGGSPFLARQRAGMFAEYDKWTDEQKRTLANVMMHENAKSPQDVLESLANRVPGEKGTRANRGGTLWEGLSGSFYSTFRAAQAAARRGQGDIGLADRAAAAVRGGSDVLEGRSDQGMWTDPGHRDMHAPGARPGTGINELGRRRRLAHIRGEWYSDKQSISVEAIRRQREAKEAYDADARTRINKSLVASRDLGGAKVKVDFSGMPENSGSDSKVLDEGPFKKLKIHRAPQAPGTGGGAADYNRFTFE
jgi:hypothetical protein